MLLTSNLVDEMNTLLLYNITNTQEGIKIHTSAEASKIAAAKRLFDKGLITQADGGYLTVLGREAAEQLHMAHTIMTTA
jgi:uncharacterized protein (TIGR02647 family)